VQLGWADWCGFGFGLVWLDWVGWLVTVRASMHVSVSAVLIACERADGLRAVLGVQ
jgi:hypothetical protein